MKFIAKTKGYFSDRIILPGEEFEADDDFAGKWAVKAKEYEPDPEPDEERLAKEAVEGLQGKKKPAKVAKKKVAKKAAVKG